MRDHRFGERVLIDVKGEQIEGVIVYAFKAGGPGKVCYHVRDDYGQYWHRTSDEMKASLKAAG